MFKAFTTRSSAFKKHNTKQTCSPERLKDHFENHFNLPEGLVPPEEIAEMPEYLKNLKRFLQTL